MEEREPAAPMKAEPVDAAVASGELVTVYRLDGDPPNQVIANGGFGGGGGRMYVATFPGDPSGREIKIVLDRFSPQSMTSKLYRFTTRITLTRQGEIPKQYFEKMVLQEGEEFTMRGTIPVADIQMWAGTAWVRLSHYQEDVKALLASRKNG